MIKLSDLIADVMKSPDEQNIAELCKVLDAETKIQRCFDLLDVLFECKHDFAAELAAEWIRKNSNAEYVDNFIVLGLSSRPDIFRECAKAWILNNVENPILSDFVRSWLINDPSENSIDWLFGWLSNSKTENLDGSVLLRTLEMISLKKLDLSSSNQKIATNCLEAWSSSAPSDNIKAIRLLITKLKNC